MQSTELEQKWRELWAESRLYEANPDKNKEKRYITAAFPYPNSPQHIGHGRTYTTADIYARYLRLKGHNVLFPMAFHVTGTPIIAMARRIAEQDQEVLDIFERIYGIDRDTALSLTDPTALVLHFSREIEDGMREMGYSTDWRRKFYSFDKKFNKFIEWQFKKLHDRGYIIQGEHPIAWCPKDNQAVGGHDTKGDVDPELKDFTAIKFRYGEGHLLTATLRPETIYGVTNIWVNPEIVHVKARSRKTNEIYYISKKAAEKMNFQGFDLEILEEVIGEKLLSTKQNAINPVTGEDVSLYPAKYVKADSGTGIVMSVPSHAPYDHIALLDMGIKLDYTPIIKVDGYQFMAKELIEQRGVKDQHDQQLEDIVKEVYKKEILTGIMVAGHYSGEKVSVAIEKTKQSMLEKKQAVVFWEVNNKPVYCRCGAEIVGSVLKNQWFIDYSNPAWKEKVKECLAQMNIIPEKTRSEYLYTIDWLKQKACARASGLGTRFPFDRNQMIEALSDSTIYMAFYTIAHLLDGIDEQEMNEEFFDYIFGLSEIEKPNTKWEKLRESFNYWYPCDSRHSGADLVRNHLPFFIFNHVAIFDRQKWPKQIVTNGFVLMDGKKMSKSMGNILPLRKAISEYGADVVRFSVVSGADLTQDTDFNKTVAEGTKTRLESIKKMVEDCISEPDTGKLSRPDQWILSKLNRKIKIASGLYEKMQLRELALEIFYSTYDDLKWYSKRAKTKYLSQFFRKWIVLIAPFMPYHAEEFWNMLGQKGFVANATFPEVDEAAINTEIELGEEIVANVRSDIENLQNLLNKRPSRIWVCVANEVKRKVYNLMAAEKTFDRIMKVASQDPELRTNMGVVQRMAKQLMKNVHSLQEILSAESELKSLENADAFFEKEFQCEVSIRLEDAPDAKKHERAKNALPNKPAIVFE